jgi:hypothetical protein
MDAYEVALVTQVKMRREATTDPSTLELKQDRRLEVKDVKVF